MSIDEMQAILDEVFGKEKAFDRTFNMWLSAESYKAFDEAMREEAKKYINRES